MDGLAWFWVSILLFVFQVTALVVISMTWQYWVIVVSLVIGGGLLFFVLSVLGERLLRLEEEREKAEAARQRLEGRHNVAMITIPE